MQPLETLLQQGLYRERHVIEEREGSVLSIAQRNCINFCSNDYLGLTSEPILKKAAHAALDEYGLGSGSSAMVSGYFAIHQQTEEAFAEFLQRDKAVLFNSGFMANIGMMGALMSAKDTVAMDKLNHASLIDGLKFCGAKHLRYRHLDMSHLQQKIQGPLDYIMTEGVFSMEGDIAPLQELSQIAAQHDAKLFVDDAHGMGVLGQQGRGVVEHFGLTQQQVPLVMCPLGKAFASQGGIIVGEKNLIEQIVQFARTYRYSTALPPLLAAVSLAALNIIKTQSWRREVLHEHIAHFQKMATHLGVNCLKSFSPIQTVMVGDNHRALHLSDVLFHKGFFVKAIRPPTVPVNTSRLRITLNVTHTKQQIDDLLTAIAYET